MESRVERCGATSTRRSETLAALRRRSCDPRVLRQRLRSFSRSTIPLLLAAACQAPDAASAGPRATNATINFVIPPAQGELARRVTVCLAVARPNAASLQNAPDAGGAIDGRAVFPAGTRPAAIVAHYAALLKQHGWVDGAHFVASGNSLHFYGITQLAAGADDTQLGIFAATDSESVPFRTVSPLVK